MSGLLLSTAQDTGVASDKEVFGQLVKRDAVNWARHMVLRGGLDRLCSVLADDGIRVAVLKGIPAEDRWYDRPGERPSQDVDLLLSPELLSGSDEIVRSLQPDHILLGNIEQLVRGQRLPEIEIWFEGIPVDLHFDFLGLGPFVRVPERVWEHMINHALGNGSEVPALNGELSLINFVLHVNRDNFRRLLGYADVARILQRENLDWMLIEAFVRAEGLETLFYGSLQRIQEDLSISVPRTPVVSGLQSRLHRRIWPAELRLRGDESRTLAPKRQFWQPFLIRRGFWAAVAWWLRRLVPPAPLTRYYQLSSSEQPTGVLRAITWERLRRSLKRARSRHDRP